jgi:hypothetical protein
VIFVQDWLSEKLTLAWMSGLILSYSTLDLIRSGHQHEGSAFVDLLLLLFNIDLSCGGG